MARQLLNLSFLTIIFCVALPLSEATEIRKAANFNASTAAGKTIQLSDFKGKYVVLEWFNNGCPYVDKHYSTQNMQNLQKKYIAKGVVWLSIFSSAPGKQGHANAKQAQAIQNERKSNATHLALDPEGKFGKLYGAKTTPHMFVINPDQQIIYQGAIDDKPGFDKSEIKEAKNYVAAALDQAMAGKKVEVNTTQPYGCSVKY